MSTASLTLAAASNGTVRLALRDSDDAALACTDARVDFAAFTLVGCTGAHVAGLATCDVADSNLISLPVTAPTRAGVCTALVAYTGLALQGNVTITTTAGLQAR